MPPLYDYECSRCGAVEEHALPHEVATEETLLFCDCQDVQEGLPVLKRRRFPAARIPADGTYSYRG